MLLYISILTSPSRHPRPQDRTNPDILAARWQTCAEGRLPATTTTTTTHTWHCGQLFVLSLCSIQWPKIIFTKLVFCLVFLCLLYFIFYTNDFVESSNHSTGKVLQGGHFSTTWRDSWVHVPIVSPWLTPAAPFPSDSAYSSPLVMSFSSYSLIPLVSHIHSSLYQHNNNCQAVDSPDSCHTPTPYSFQ